ncbi:OpgC domain-containing protein [Paraburkholderia ferrariae]|uniref:OpgC domain-containing protein n=1 Tax=Paraburkholderia ferrariae TaxID=386056 RepID=A0ABU9S1H0_9BURK
MHSSTSRLPELDFLRGLALLIVVVDHVSGSVVSHITLHTYALCDAAEAFVFLAGYSTATAWTTLAAYRDKAAARRWFIKRAWVIYRAFLFTAGLLLLASAVLRAFHIETPHTARDLQQLIASPATVLRDIVLLRRQPYLASVLPMYVLFALAAPVMVPLARERPWLLVALSFGLWAVAGTLYWYLPAALNNRWDFNPFAWQLVFVLGALARCQPVYQHIDSARFGKIAWLAALAIIASGAYYKLRIEPSTPGIMKRDLEWPRAVNFIALAWLVADLVRRGWIRHAAERAPWVGAIGRTSLQCFVAGTVVSLSADAVLARTTGGQHDVWLGLAADAVTILSVFAVASLASLPARALTSRLRKRLRL